MNEAQVMGVLAEQIVCECGNNSDDARFIPPYYEARYRIISRFDITDIGKLEEDTFGSLDEDVDWTSGTDGHYFCGACGEEVFVPEKMRAEGY